MKRGNKQKGIEIIDESDIDDSNQLVNLAEPSDKQNEKKAEKLNVMNLNHLDVNSYKRIARYLTPMDTIALTKCCRTLFYSFMPFAVRDVFAAILRDDKESLHEMLNNQPLLLNQRGYSKNAITNDFTSKICSNMTAYQVALATLDVAAVTAMRKIYVHDEVHQKELENQKNELFPNGCRAHCASQASFDLSELARVITASSDQEVKAAIDKEKNNSRLNRSLNQFRQDFARQSREEKIFNPQHIINAFEVFTDHLDRWDKNKRDLFMYQVLGYMQRFLPAAILKDIAQGIFHQVDEDEVVRDSFQFRSGEGEIYPFEPNSGLGFDYVVFDGKAQRNIAYSSAGYSIMKLEFRAFEKYMTNKTVLIDFMHTKPREAMSLSVV